jgi:hypothetical protein
MFLELEEIDPPEFKTPAFSPAVIAKYSRATPFYHAWSCLTSIPLPQEIKDIIPLCHSKFSVYFSMKSSVPFLDFCQDSDHVAAQKGCLSWVGRFWKVLGFRNSCKCYCGF